MEYRSPNTQNENLVSPDSEYKKFATDLAYKAGEIMRENFKMGASATWKEDNTPLTDSDIAINQFVLDSIKTTYPGHSILAEEESDLRDSEYVWVCDPIDGTIPFSTGEPISTFALALTKNGESVLGVIYDPFLDRMVVGEKGKGTTVNGKPVHVSTHEDLANTIIDIESWYSSAFDINYSINNKLISLKSMPKTDRSASYSSILLAMGGYQGVIFGGKTAWDAAAAKVIVEEAGGRMTDLYGNDQEYNKDIKGFIASNGKLHDKLVELAQPFVSKNTRI